MITLSIVVIIVGAIVLLPSLVVNGVLGLLFFRLFWAKEKLTR